MRRSDAGRSGRLPDPVAMSKPTQLSLLSSPASLPHDTHFSAAAAKGPQLADDYMDKPQSRHSSPVQQTPAATKERSGHSQSSHNTEKATTEDKSLAPLSGRGLSPMRALGSIMNSQSGKPPGPLSLSAPASHIAEAKSERYSTPTPTDRYDIPVGTPNRSPESVSSSNRLQQVIQQLEQEKARLLDTLASNDLSMNEQRTTVHRLNLEVQELKQERQLLEMDKSSLQAMNQKMQSTIDSLNTAVRNSVSMSSTVSDPFEIAKLQEQINLLNQQQISSTMLIRELEDKNSSLSNENSSMKETANSQREQVMQLQKQMWELEGIKSKYDSVISAHQQLQQSHSEVKHSFANLQHTCDTQEAELSALRSDADESRQQLAHLQMIKTSNEEAILQLENRLSGKTSELQDLTNKCKLLKDENIEFLNRQIFGSPKDGTRDESKEQIELLQKHLHEAQAKLSSHNQLIADLENKVSSVVAEKAFLQREVDALRASRDSHHTSPTVLREKDEEATNMKKQIADLDETVSSLTAQLVQSKLDSIGNKDPVNLHSSFESLEKQIKDLNTKLFTSEHHEAQLKVQLANQLRELSDLQSRAQVWSAEKQTMQKQILDLQSKEHAWNNERATLLLESNKSTPTAAVDNSELHLMQRNLSACKEQLLAANNELQDQKFKYDLLITSHAKLKEGIAQKDAEIEDLRDGNINKNREVHAAALMVEDEKFNNKLLQAQVDNLTKSLNALSVASTSQPNSGDTEILRQQLQDCRSQLLSKQLAMQELETQRSLLNEEKTRLAGQLQERDASISSLRAGMDESKFSASLLCNQVTELKDVVAKKENSINDLHMQLHIKQSELLDLQMKIAEIQHKYEQLQNTVIGQGVPSVVVPDLLHGNPADAYKAQIAASQQAVQDLNDRIKLFLVEKAQSAEKLRQSELLVQSKSDEIAEQARKIRGYQEEIMQLQRLLQLKDNAPKREVMHTEQEKFTTTPAVSATTAGTSIPPSAHQSTAGFEQRMEEMVVNPVSKLLQASKHAVANPPQEMLFDEVLDPVVLIGDPLLGVARQPIALDGQSISHIVNHFSKYTMNFLAWAQSANADLTNIASFHQSSARDRNGGNLLQLLQLLQFRREQEVFYSKVLSDFLCQCKEMVQAQRGYVKTLKANPQGNSKQNVHQVNQVILQLNNSIRAVKDLQQLADQRDALLQRLQGTQSALSNADPVGYLYQKGADIAKSISVCNQLLAALTGITNAVQVLDASSGGDDMAIESYFQDHLVDAIRPPIIRSRPAEHPTYPQQIYAPPPPPPSYSTPTPSTAGVVNLQNQISHHHQLGHKHQLDTVKRQIQDICARQDSSKQACDQYFR